MGDVRLSDRLGSRALLAGVVTVLACQRQGPLAAREFHVSPGGDDRGDCARAQQASTPRRTIRAALACAQAGDTVSLHEGRFDERVAHWPSGAPGRYLTIRAIREGAVILSGGLKLSGDSRYLVFIGMRFHGGEKTIIGDHLKFFRNEWKGSCPATNCSTVTVGAIGAATTADVLFEDNWFHGLGGRANIATFNASRVLVRRAVVRHDGGWANAQGYEPIESAVVAHNSRDTVFQDVLVVDSNLGYHAWQGAFLVQKDSSSTTPGRNLGFQGILALDVALAGFQVLGGGLIEELGIERSIFIGSGSGVRLGHGSLQTTRLADLVVTRRGSPESAPSTGIEFLGTGQIVVERAQVTGYARPLVGPVADRTPGRGPLEPPLVRRHGRDGTSYGEPGWDEHTRTPLWPWPEQERIQRELCRDAGVSRGFCAAPCLSDHVLRALGRPVAIACGSRSAGASRTAPPGTATDRAPVAAEVVPDGGGAAVPVDFDDLVAPACPPPACLQAGGTEAAAALDEFGRQWGSFTLEAEVNIAAETEAWLSLAEQPPLPDERLPVAVPLSAGSDERFTLRVAVDVPRATYQAVAIGADGRQRSLARDRSFAVAARSLAYAALHGDPGNIRLCRTRLSLPTCFTSTAGGPPVRVGFPAQAGALVALAESTAPAVQAGRIGLAGRTTLDHELPVQVAEPAGGGGGNTPVRLRLDPQAQARLWPQRVSLLIDRWEVTATSGSVTFCRPEIRVPRCLVARAQRGIRPHHQSFCPQRARFTARARIVPGPGRLDAGIGLASGAVGEWNSLGPIVRFSPAGVIDVNDGPGYLPSTLSYRPGQPHLIRLVVDPVARRYDAFITLPDGPEHTLGRGLRFRNQHLDHFDAFVLPIDIGELSVCDLTVHR